MLMPSASKEYFNFLIEKDLLEDAMSLLNERVEREEPKPKEAHFELLELISTHPSRATHVDSKKIISLALDLYTEDTASI